MYDCTSLWDDYELIDSGAFEKLERFGRFVLVRPEPQALWPKALAEAEWNRLASAVFRKDSIKSNDNERGEWQIREGMSQQWHVAYRYKAMSLTFRLGLTTFKHVGLFPEQAANWNYIYDRVADFGAAETRVLNLFAYTGGASLAARAAGADVTHVDAVRQVITWSRENMEASGLDNIRWMMDDALKYLRREVRRGKRYHGIIMDPPAYGRGPAGEKWVLDEGIAELMELCRALAAPERFFLVLNLYSMGYSPTIAENLIKAYFPNIACENGELCATDRAGRRLPLGIFARGNM